MALKMVSCQVLVTTRLLSQVPTVYTNEIRAAVRDIASLALALPRHRIVPLGKNKAKAQQKQPFDHRSYYSLALP